MLPQTLPRRLHRHTPAPAAANPADDLFGAPMNAAPAPATPAPATPAPGSPAPAAADDLFGAPAAAPATPPAGEKPANSLDDIFGGSAPAKPAPTNTPPADAGKKPEGAKPAGNNSLDDLFGTGASMKPSDRETPVAADNPSSSQNPAEKPADSKSAPADALFQDLFSANAAANNDGASANLLPNLPYRDWTDNTSQFKTKGRLVRVGDDYVRLLKENGRTCTVPLRRLSPEDVAYVTSTVAALSASSTEVFVSK